MIFAMSDLQAFLVGVAANDVKVEPILRKRRFRRSGRIEARAALILQLVEETTDFTLVELRSRLAARVGVATLWPSSSVAGSRWKKRWRTRPSKIARTS